MQKLTVERLLSKLGFGTRKECRALVRAGLVELAGRTVEDPFEELDAKPETIMVNGEEVPTFEELYLMMNKPCGLECSHQPRDHESVFESFPHRMLEMGLNCVGRLDADSHGLLLFSNQGQFIHRVESPKKGMLKTYVAKLARPITDPQIRVLKEGVQLKGEKKLFIARELEKVSDTVEKISIAEGVYHEVRRMFAAVSNHVEDLERISIGHVKLDPQLELGKWRFLTAAERAEFQ